MLSPGKQPSRQRGAVLIISIVLLVVLTLLGLYLSQSGILELRMAENAASRSIALQVAETARSAAEQQARTIAKQMDKQSDAYDCAALGAGYYAAAAASSTNGNVSGCKPLVANSLNWNAQDSLATANGLRYVIEYLGIQDIKNPNDVELGGGSTPTYHVFRILARGTEAAGGKVTLQSVYVVLNS